MVSLTAAALFEIPGHKRVVGLVGGTAVRDVVIPMRAVCRYPDLIFREEARLGRVFGIATKDADHKEEVLYPVSALTPPPPPGCSDLPLCRASALPELSLAAAATTAIPELVSSGGLTPQQGVAVAGMISAEDPVIFAAFLVAGTAGAHGRGDLGHALETCADANPLGGESMVGGVGRKWVRGDALRSLASMLEMVLADRARGRVRLGRRRPGAVDGVAPGTRCQDTSERETGAKGGGGEKKFHASPSVPEWFQADAIALADVALVTGKITKTTYIRALHRAVTLDHGLVRAYHADLDRHRRRGGYEGKPQVTHRAFGAGVAETPPPTSAPCTAMAGGGGGGGGVDGGSKGSGGGATGDEVRTRETEPKHGLLRQALSWIEEGTATGGLSARHRAIVERAIATEHPWVSAIYEECKETGDVRGLVLNLQRLPALLERDQATAYTADVSEPPPPGEADSPFWLRQQHQSRQPRPHERRDVCQAQDIQAPPRSLPSERRWSGTRDSANVSDGINATNDTNGNNGAYGGGGDGGTDPSTSQNVREQLGRVIAGCSKLLQMRGAIGEMQARALSVMASRASPALLAALEAYQANQDIEDLLRTLQTVVKAEPSLDEENSDGQKVRPLRTFRHQVFQKQQKQQQQSPKTGDAGVRRYKKGSGHPDQQRVTNAASAAATGATATAGTALSPVGPFAAGGREDGGGITSDKQIATSCWIRAVVRRSASGARAQELVSAKFAGIRSAAEARARASGDVGVGVGVGAKASTASAASSSGHQGTYDVETSGDKRLRQDVSHLIAVMDKSKMLTDRQRVYLLAQMGQRITQAARERHVRYRESGDSKELYAVLMALSAPASRD
ncbi:unnamed protein product, partial [Ascophyllum nodosum]